MGVCELLELAHWFQRGQSRAGALLRVLFDCESPTKWRSAKDIHTPRLESQFAPFLLLRPQEVQDVQEVQVGHFLVTEPGTQRRESDQNWSTKGSPQKLHRKNTTGMTRCSSRKSFDTICSPTMLRVHMNLQTAAITINHETHVHLLTPPPPPPPPPPPYPPSSP